MSFLLTLSCQSKRSSARDELLADLSRIQIYILCIIIVFFHYYINIKYSPPSLLETLWQSERIHLIQLKPLREKNNDYRSASVWSALLVSERQPMKLSWRDILESWCCMTHCDYFVNLYIPDIYNKTWFSLRETGVISSPRIHKHFCRSVYGDIRIFER